MSTNSKTHNTLYTSKNSIIASIIYFYAEQKAKQNPVGQILVGCQNIVQEKYSRNKFHTAIYQEKNIYN